MTGDVESIKKTMPHRRKLPAPDALASHSRCKPRGKPFEKGNKVGRQFQPGESGNPGGLSKLRCLTNELHRQLPGFAEKLIENLIKRALKNFRDLEMLWNRSEGLVSQERENFPTGVTVVIDAANRPPRHLQNPAPPALPGNGIPPNGNGEPT
jgi:hypothetical protein